jgi:polysaccharide chain length determinant protein (PEP-CTERM system associated)
LVNDRKGLGLVAQARELWPVLIQRRWVILLAGVLLSATSIVAICLLPDWYSATITILVDPQKIPERYAPDSVTMDQLRYDTLSQQILSTPRLQQAIDELQLYPELRACMSPGAVVEYMRKNVAVQVRSGGDRNAGTFTITYRGKNAALVARVVAWLADSFIQWNFAARQHQAEGASGFVSDQLDEAKKTLDEQESRLSAFKSQHLGELPEQLEPNSAALSRLQQALQANADALNRLEMERTLSVQSPGASAVSERTHLTEEQRKLEQEITGLRARYSDEYPDVMQARERLAEVRERLSASSPDTKAADAGDVKMTALNREIQVTQEERRRLLTQVSSYQAKVEIAPLREQQFTDLSQVYQNAKAHYLSLLDKQFSAESAVELERQREAERFSVLDPARVPEQPIKPHRLLMISFMVPFCFLFSGSMAIIVQKSRGRISTERTLRSILPDSIAIVGRIPRIKTAAYVRRQQQWATFSIITSLLCCITVVFVVWKVHPHF